MTARLMSEPPTLYVIGCGAVGCGLALAHTSRGGRVAGLWNRGDENAARAERLLNIPVRRGPLQAVGGILNEADIIIVSVVDSAIAEIGIRLAERGLRAGVAVAHTSGVRPAAELGDLGPAVTASCHPLVACPSPERAAEAMQSALFTLEGDKHAIAELQKIVGLLGGRSEIISSEGKPRYHAAAVLASNLVVALVDMAIEQGVVAGLSDGRAAIVALAQNAIAQLVDLPPPSALTGPVLRGDIATIRTHLDALGPTQTAEVYRLLSQRALELARARGLGDDALDALYELFEESRTQ